jgi:uncharacterized protein YggE
VLNDARVQASKLADAAGLRVGRIVSIGQGASQQAVQAAYAVFTVVVPAGSFSPASYTGLPAYNVPRTCSLTVQFELLQ